MAGPKNLKRQKARDFPALSPVRTGLRGACPRCGEGRLFSGLLTLSESCSACDLDFGFADAGDGPAVFVIFLLGAIATMGVLYFEFALGVSYAVNLTFWIVFTLTASLFLLRALKGWLIAQQYVKDAAEGRLG